MCCETPNELVRQSLQEQFLALKKKLKTETFTVGNELQKLFCRCWYLHLLLIIVGNYKFFITDVHNITTYYYGGKLKIHVFLLIVKCVVEQQFSHHLYPKHRIPEFVITVF